jgi:flagellar hook-length control protein FliK
VGINSNLVTLGSPMPAQKTDPGQGSQPNNATDAGSPDGSTAASGADASSASTSSQKTAGPSAQRRSNPRTTHARSTAAGPTGNPAGADPQIVAPEPVADFGSVMASALGRSVSGGNDSAAPLSAASDTTDTKAPTPSPQQAAGTADPAAWLAQALMPPAAAPAAAGAPGTAGAAAPASATAGPALIELSSDPGSAAVAAQTTAGVAAQLAAQNALAAAPSPRSAANALRGALNANSAPAPIAPGSDAQTAAAVTAAAPGNINVMADAQKLISGLTGPDSADADAAPPVTHTAPASAGTDTTQAAAALQAASLSRPSVLGATTLTIHAPVGSAAFADEVGARATSLAQSGITQAQLQMNPADMGPVQVHITLQAGQASVWFGANHADTRAALEQSLPRLRELFAGAGMPLTDSGVFREPPQQQQTQPLVAAGGVRTPLSETQVATSVTQVANVRLSLLDTYA